MFENNFGKCGPIFKILSSIDLQENYVCIVYMTKTCSVLLHYLVKFEMYCFRDKARYWVENCDFS